MIPEEKAKELYLKYCPYDVIYCDPLGCELEGYYERHAKRCAMIAVDLILTDLVIPIGITSEAYKYFEQVKEELKKM